MSTFPATTAPTRRPRSPANVARRSFSGPIRSAGKDMERPLGACAHPSRRRRCRRRLRRGQPRGSDFLSKMNDFLVITGGEGHSGYLVVKNPTDSWVTRAYAVGYWFTNRFWQAARDHVGLSARSAEPGSSSGRHVPEAHGADRESYEDLEMTAMLVLAGERSSGTRVRSCTTRSPSRSGRRCARGSAGCRGTTGFREVRPKALRLFATTRRLRYLDLVLYLLVPQALPVDLRARTAVYAEWVPGILKTPQGFAAFFRSP